MILYNLNHDYHYEMENMCRLFFPQEQINVKDIASCDEISTELENITVVTEKQEAKDNVILNFRVVVNDMSLDISDTVTLKKPLTDRKCEADFGGLLYKNLGAICGFYPKWGIITGVRPVKLLRSLRNEFGSQQKADEYFKNTMLVSDEKLELAKKTMKAEEKVLGLNTPDSFSLYLSVPFCPTRCNYCSFVSADIDHAKKEIPAYVDNMIREIVKTGEIAKKLNLRLETIYMGGGTPTTLTAEQMDKVLTAVGQNFDMSTVREYTVEAGRPDTITRDKLAVLKKQNVSRISINPQTFNDDVLDNIGRKHTTKQTVDSFNLAREMGFNNINMDLIAGLPGDDIDKFENTMNYIRKLQPESVTVHTLYLKRSSNIYQKGSVKANPKSIEADEMVSMSCNVLTELGYYPYYLYRQSRTLGNLENTGWCKEGFEGYYNSFIMDETHTILAVGAGASTKLRQPGGKTIERVFNYKFPFEYNKRFDEIIRRKDEVVKFYERYESKK